MKGKHLKIPFHRTKIGANFRNFVLKHFAEENMFLILFAGTGNFRFESLSQNMAAKTLKKMQEKTIFEVHTNNFFNYFGYFVQLIFLLHSIPFRSPELTLPWTSELEFLKSLWGLGTEEE